MREARKTSTISRRCSRPPWRRSIWCSSVPRRRRRWKQDGPCEPMASELLWNCVRGLTRLLGRARDVLGTTKVSFGNRTRRAKKHRKEILQFVDAASVVGLKLGTEPLCGPERIPGRRQRATVNRQRFHYPERWAIVRW